MEPNYDNRDFEHFVKQNANQYRMYPSEKVWKGIHNKLHSRRRWLGIGFLFIGLVIATATLVMIGSPLPEKMALNKPATPANEPAHNENNSISVLVSPSNQTSNQSKTVIPFTIHSTQESEIPVNSNNPVAISTLIDELIEVDASNQKTFTDISIPVKIELDNNLPVTVQISDLATDENADLTTTSTQSAEVDNDLKTNLQKNIYPLSIESVINLYRASVKKNVTFQAYFTPSISYRRLSENNSFLRSTAANNQTNSIVASYDINKAVTHKPGLGLELGLSARYPIAKNIKLKGGLQLNINRYDIKAFNSSGEVATISLNQGSSASSLYTWTKYRNFNGYTSNWLQNYYLSVSAPVGAEIKIAGNKKSWLGLAGTIQPTFVVHDRAYLITTDYKNYAEIPWLIRRWNVNTSFEAFVNNSSGKIKWQLGPQIRYQLLSSFQNKYPVKENLFDYGIKLGIMLNQ